jgi:hypothetical protein
LKLLAKNQVNQGGWGELILRRLNGGCFALIWRKKSVFAAVLGLSLTPANRLKITGLTAVTSGMALSCGLIDHFNECLCAHTAAFFTSPSDGIIGKSGRTLTVTRLAKFVDRFYAVQWSFASWF